MESPYAKRFLVRHGRACRGVVLLDDMGSLQLGWTRREASPSECGAFSMPRARGPDANWAVVTLFVWTAIGRLPDDVEK